MRRLQKKKMSEDEMKKLNEQYDQMTDKFQKEKDEYVVTVITC